MSERNDANQKQQSAPNNSVYLYCTHHEVVPSAQLVSVSAVSGYWRQHVWNSFLFPPPSTHTQSHEPPAFWCVGGSAHGKRERRVSHLHRQPPVSPAAQTGAEANRSRDSPSHPWSRQTDEAPLATDEVEFNHREQRRELQRREGTSYTGGTIPLHSRRDEKLFVCGGGGGVQ